MGDENSKKEMSIVTSTWGDLCQSYELTVAPIHHFTKAGEGTLLQRLRGSGDIGALVRHIVGVDKQADGRTELSFDGNLHPLPDPFLVRMVDAITAEGKPCIRFEDAGSATTATCDRIDKAILAAVEDAGIVGATASAIEKQVEGNSDMIRARRNTLVERGRIAKVPGKGNAMRFVVVQREPAEARGALPDGRRVFTSKERP